MAVRLCQWGRWS